MGKIFRRNDNHRPRGGKLKDKGFRKWKEFEDDKYRKDDHRVPHIIEPVEPIEVDRLEPDV